MLQSFARLPKIVASCSTAREKPNMTDQTESLPRHPADALRLITAFRRVRDPGQRRAVIDVVERLARQPEVTKERLTLGNRREP